MLASLPEGLYRDEAFNILDEVTLGWRNHPSFFSANEGREALFLYWQCVFLLVFGTSTFAVRLASTSIALLTVALDYVVVARGFGRRIGLYAGAALATLYPFVHDTRIGLRFTTLPFFVVLTIAAMQWALSTRKLRAFCLLGVCIGLAVETYTAALALPLMAGAVTAFALVTRPSYWRAWLKGALSTAATAVLVSAPLLHYLLTHPGGLKRMSETSALQQSSAVPAAFSVARNVVAYAASIGIEGDHQWITNVPGRPIFDPLMAILCVTGIVILLFQVVQRDGQATISRSDASALWLCALGAMLVPGFLSLDAPYYQRVFGIMPALALAPALSMAFLERTVTRSRVPAPWAVLVAIVPLAMQTGRSAHGYFVEWGQNPEAVFYFNNGASSIGRYLEHVRPNEPVSVFTYDTAVVKALAPQVSESVQWYHASELVPLPHNVQGDSLYLFDLADPSPLETELQSVAAKSFSAIDRNAGNVVARGYRVSPSTKLASLFPSSATTAFADRLALTGVQVDADPKEQGAYFVNFGVRAMRDSPGYLSLSVRAVDGANRVWGQQDSFGADVSHWPDGQEALSSHHVHLLAGTPPGTLKFVVEVYDLVTGTTLSRDDGKGTILSAGDVTVARVIPNHFGERYPVTLALGLKLDDHVTLNGYRIDTPTVRQDATVSLDVVWTCQSSEPHGTSLAFELVDSQGVVRGNFDIGGGLTAPSPDSCASGATYLDRRSFSVGARFPAGEYGIAAKIGGAQGAITSPLVPNAIRVTPLDRRYDAPQTQTSVHAVFDDGVALAGLTTSTTPDKRFLDADLVWNATSDPSRGYTAFVHLIGPNGVLVAQHDGIPDNGAWPTDTWVAGQFIIDHHRIALPSGGIPQGSEIELGLYDAESGKRLALYAAIAGRIVNDALQMPLAP
jgi:hypothetical protein